MMANQYMFFNIPQSLGISQLYFAVGQHILSTKIQIR